MMEAQKIAPPDKIASLGVYLLDIDYYHGDCTDGPGISSSGLRTIEAKSEAHYFATSYLNPNRAPEETADHFEFGKAAHSLFLGEAFKEHYAVRPAKFKDWRTDASREWRADQQLAGKGILVPDQLVALEAIARSLAAHPLIKSGLLQGKVEHSIIWKDPVTGVWLRSRPDVLPEADGVAVDIKTTTDASPEAIQRACLQLGYPLQGALIGMGMKAVMGIQMTDFVLVWIEKTPPYAVNVSPVDSEWIYWAMRQLRRAIDRFAKAVESNEWPAYSGEQVTYLPEWFKKRLERDAECGLLPEVEAA